MSSYTPQTFATGGGTNGCYFSYNLSPNGGGSVQMSDGLCGDPGEGTVKNARVVYTCGGTQFIIYSAEYQAVTFRHVHGERGIRPGLFLRFPGQYDRLQLLPGIFAPGELRLRDRPAAGRYDQRHDRRPVHGVRGGFGLPAGKRNGRFRGHDRELHADESRAAPDLQNVHGRFHAQYLRGFLAEGAALFVQHPAKLRFQQPRIQNGPVNASVSATPPRGISSTATWARRTRSVFPPT